MKHPKRRKLLSRAWMGLIAYGGMASCLATAPGLATDAPAAQPAGAASVIASRLAPGATAGAFDSQDRDDVAAFYAARELRPVWVDERGPTRAATLAIQELGHAADWGLDANDFKLEAGNRPMIDGQRSATETADAELAITADVLRYAHQAQGGRIPDPTKLLSSYLDRQPVLSPAAEILTGVTNSTDLGQILRSYQPSQDQFLKLKALLAKLRGSSDAAEPQGFLIAARGPMLQAGVHHPEVAILKKRFGVSSEQGVGDLFDEPLERAVKAFQAQSELASDGIVGPQTRRVLAGAETETSSEDKIAAVIANMEEWRWMPRDLGAKHVLVNIPSFSIALTNDDRTVFEDRVVVGTPSTQTPIFSKDMTTIVLRPQWYLPDSIKLSTLLGGRPLEGMGYVVMRNGRRVDSSRVDWSKANLKEYEIYQPSGDDNALGLVKLLFPNKHSVYLHDTPSKHLFDQSVRLFSHGCMRVRNPQILAQRIFDIDTHQSTVPDVMRLVRSGPMNNQFTLQTPIPVHVGYFTVWVDDNGEAQFYKDYYGHQKRITLALAGKWNEIDVGVDHLAEVDTSLLRNVKLGSEKKDDDADDKAVARSSDNSINSVGDLIRRSLGL